MFSRACSTSPPTFSPVVISEVSLIHAGDESGGSRTTKGLRERLLGGGLESLAQRSASPRRPLLRQGCRHVPPQGGSHLAAAEYFGGRARLGHGRCGRPGGR